LLPVGFVLKDKSQTILSTIYKENAKSMIKRDKQGLLVGEFVDRDKAHCLDANYWKGGNLKSYFEKHRRQLVFEQNYSESSQSLNRFMKNTKGLNEKSNCMTMTMYKGMASNGCTNIIENFKYRKLTPLECERLQTVPDNYTNHVSNTQRYKMLGNGWTVDVIAHIFKAMKQNVVKQTDDI
jgi:site-specific DNA-cytosine methylase